MSSAHCIIGTQKNADAGIILSYADDEYSQGYTQIGQVFTCLTKGDIRQPYRSDHDLIYPLTLVSEGLRLVKNFEFSKYDIKKNSRLLNQ